MLQHFKLNYLASDASFPNQNKTRFMGVRAWGLSTAQPRTSKLSWKASFFQNQFLCESLQWSEFFPFIPPFLRASTRAADRPRPDTYLLESGKEWQTSHHSGRGSLSKKTFSFWEWRIICILWEFLVSNLTQELSPQGWEGESELETKNSLRGIPIKKKEKKKKHVLLPFLTGIL